MNAKKAKRLRKFAYGDNAQRGTRYIAPAPTRWGDFTVPQQEKMLAYLDKNAPAEAEKLRNFVMQGQNPVFSVNTLLSIGARRAYKAAKRSMNLYNTPLPPAPLISRQ